MYMHGFTRLQQWRDHWDFLGRELAGEGVFLTDRRIAPALRAIELGDHRLGLLDADLVHPVFVAIERQYSAVAAKPHGLDRIQHGLGR